ncbi:MAG: hypothetical protein ABEH66_06085 [Halobacteriales archaeon]
MRRQTATRVGVSLLAAVLFAEPALAHVGGLSGGTGGNVPTWLTIGTGGVIVGASFLFTSLLTDHEAIVNAWHLHARVPGSARSALTWAVRAAGIAVLALVLASGFFGPNRSSAALFTPTESFAIMVVWAGWWAGYVMSVYLIGNTWPALNPWRALVALLPRLRRREYPERLGAWPAVAGLLALVWIEVVSPVAQAPQLLATVVLGYTVVTLAGVALYGADAWFDRVDPIARALRAYGWIAPFQRTGDGIALTLPTTALADHRLREEPGAAAFVVALLWVTTYDGLVATPTWEAAITPLVEAGIPALPIYFLAIVTGFCLFYRVYKTASRKARETAGTYVTAAYLARYFAPALLPIAAGYHVAHFLGYLLSLLPALIAVLPHPLSAPPYSYVLSVPDWFGIVGVLLVLLGHVLAIWIAHARSFELFPGVFKPIRSQYPLTVVMIFYTMASLWVVVQPFGAPPYV